MSFSVLAKEVMFPGPFVCFCLFVCLFEEDVNTTGPIFMKLSGGGVAWVKEEPTKLWSGSVSRADPQKMMNRTLRDGLGRGLCSPSTFRHGDYLNNYMVLV